MKNPLYFPSLKGKFGSWHYYSAVMRLKDVATRVSYASELHKNKGLSDMLQRVLDEERAETIATYLINQDDRFFNSIVVAVYGGEPKWFAAGRITARNPELEVDKIEESTQERLGFLKLRGDEKLFPLDGQHRLAGIREAVKEDPSIGRDVQSVIFVGHKKTPAGQQRTRRLFTTLNKTAEPVSKNEIIALDEDDVMAIVARRLVETNPWFKGKRIAFNPAPNLAPKDVTSLTTIINLYDVLSVLFSKIYQNQRIDELKYYRPPDPDLDSYYQQARDYFRLLRDHFPALDRYFAARNFSKVVKLFRGDFGGHILFRPIGLTVITEVIAELRKSRTLAKAVAAVSHLPVTLSGPPYLDVLWDRKRGMLGNQGRALARDLLLYMLGEISPYRAKHVGERYARVLGLQLGRWRTVLRKLPRVN